MILGEFMKKVKRKVNRRIAIVVLIPVICIALLIANFTSIRLSIKGYHKEDKKVVLKLERHI
jgi:D-alanyl-D-alanine carboxypeptidase